MLAQDLLGCLAGILVVENSLDTDARALTTGLPLQMFGSMPILLIWLLIAPA
jgi:hypothetical protein